MKNKKITFLLLASLVLVWGVVFARIYGAMDEEKALIGNITSPKTTYFNMVSHENDSVELTLHYRNPFSALTYQQVEEVTEEKASHLPVAKLPIKPTINWSGISYAGFINNASNKQKVAILSVNGKTILLGEGQEDAGIKLIKWAKDSVKLAYQNEQKFIALK